MKYDDVDHYSIWLETENPNCPHRKAIDEISRTTGTPAFTPHITLIGDIRRQGVDVIQKKIDELAGYTCAFDVHFGYFFIGPNWLNVILIFARQNSTLTNLHLRAERVFEKRSLLYLPHMSLLYGKVSRVVKKRVIKKVKEDGILKHSFTVNRISLWHCRNGVANWKRITSVELRPTPK